MAAGATGAFTASKELVAHIRDQRLGLWEAMEEENAEQARLCKSRLRRGVPGLPGKTRTDFTGGKLPFAMHDL